MLFLFLIAISLSAVVMAVSAILSERKEHKRIKEESKRFEEEYPGKSST